MPPKRNVDARAKDFKGSAKKLIKELKPFRVQIIIVMILVVISSALSILTPVFLNTIMRTMARDIQQITLNPFGNYPVDTSASYLFSYSLGVLKVNWSFVGLYFGLIIGFYILSSVINLIADWMLVKVSAAFAYQKREEVKEKLDKMPLSYFDNNLVGDIISRGTNDIDEISRSLQQIINQTLSAITTLIGVLIAMFAISWQLTLVALVMLPLNIIIALVVMKLSQKRFVAYRKKLGELNGNIEENYSGYRIIKLYNMEKNVIENFSGVNEDLAKADRWSQWLSSLIFPMMRFVSNLGFVGVSLVAGLVGQSNPEIIGTMGVFFLFLNIFQRPFQQLGQISSQIQAMIAAAERVFILLGETEQTPDREGAIDDETMIDGKYDIEHVNFSYVSDRELIKDLNLKVNRGDSVAIVGPTGAGKTTIVNLLMRFYDIDAGQIILDGRDINDYTRRAVRDSVGMVLQDTWLFSGTIRENVRYGNANATDEEIEAACVAARADHFIRTLPGGYDFHLAEDGTNISQGQRQLLTIARALVSEPRVIILDEATSSVDTRTELAVQEAMNEMMKDKTSFVIAHRLSTIKNAKVILVMNKGNIVEKGNHQELLALNGFYAELYNAQFSGNNPLAPKDELEEQHT